MVYLAVLALLRVAGRVLAPHRRRAARRRVGARDWLEPTALVKVRVEFAHLAPPAAPLRFLLVLLGLGFGVWGSGFRV